MVYDALAESIALIETRALHPILRLSRRRRFVPMAMDVAGDIAATMFLRRGAGCVHEEVWQLSLRDGQWRMLGGGGGTSDDEARLADRPEIIAQEVHSAWNTLSGIDPQVLAGGGSAGGVHDSGGRNGLFPWGGGWVSYTTLFARAQGRTIRAPNPDITVALPRRNPLARGGRPPPQGASDDGNG